MRRVIACILTLVYLGFTTGAIACEPYCTEANFVAKIVNNYISDDPGRQSSDCFHSHVNDINLHKIQKHFAASRPAKVLGLYMVATSQQYTRLANRFQPKKLTNTLSSSFTSTEIFIENCVLRI